MTERQVTMIEVLLVVIGLGVVLWLAARESGQAQALHDRAEQAEAHVNQMKTAATGAYSLIPTAEIHCEDPGEGYCRRYKVYKLTGID